jgi:hypothetical protein
MRLGFRVFLAVGLIPMSAACGDGRTASTWVPFCRRPPAEEAEYTITSNGERLVEGDIKGPVALWAEKSHNGRALWAVILRVGGVRLVLLHDTSPSVEAPGDPGWRGGRWLSYNRVTKRVLSRPLNNSIADPYPTSVVEVALGCPVSDLLF